MTYTQSKKIAARKELLAKVFVALQVTIIFAVVAGHYVVTITK